jgi:hypothetical protein
LWENDDDIFFFARTVATPPRDDFLISLSLSLFRYHASRWIILRILSCNA